MKHKLVVAVIVTVLVACAEEREAQGDAGAAPVASVKGDATAGEAVAAAWCASCHSTAAADSAGTDVGPPWSIVAADPEMTDDYLTGFLTAPHGQMETLSLSRQQIRDLIAYIRTLAPS